MPNEMQTLEREHARDLPAAPINPFGSSAPVASNAAAATDQTRAIAAVQAAMLLARKFPRDERAAMDRIINAFSRPSLAEVAQYQYSKGGSDVRGPSIRAAEALAQSWGNVHCGVEEIEQRPGESTVRVYAVDAETGFHDEKVFQVPHIRFTRKGTYKIEDPREIYELIANQGARRKRACLLAVIPGDVVEAAMKQADVTLHTKAEVTPERLQNLADKFAEFGVTKEQIEARIQRRLDAMTPAQLVNLGKIYNSLRDGMSVAADWFEPTASTGGDNGAGQQQAAATRGAAGLKAAAAAKTTPKAAAETAQQQDAGLGALTQAQVMDAIHKATTPEAIEAAIALIPRITDESHRAEADIAGRAKKKQISAELDKKAAT